MSLVEIPETLVQKSTYPSLSLVILSLSQILFKLIFESSGNTSLGCMNELNDAKIEFASGLEVAESCFTPPSAKTIVAVTKLFINNA